MVTIRNDNKSKRRQAERILIKILVKTVTNGNGDMYMQNRQAPDMYFKYLFLHGV